MTSEQFTFAGFAWPRRIPRLVSPDYCGMPAPLARMAERYRTRFQPGDPEKPESAYPPRPHRYKVNSSYYTAPRAKDAGQGGSGYLESDFALGLRWKWADKVDGARIEHTGWYTDDDGSGESIRGVVWSLTRGRGFLAGWSMGEGMASLIDLRVYPDEIGAARGADRMAELVAEDERERNTVCRKRQRFEEIKEELAQELEARRELRKTRGYIKGRSGQSIALRKVVTRDINRSLSRTETLADEAETIEREYSDAPTWSEF